jgi:rare lipoprotein A
MGSVVLGGFVFGVLGGCASSPQTPPPIQAVAHVDDYITHAKLIKDPPSRTGNPDSYTVFGKDYFVEKTSEGYREQGLASWYGPKFHGKRTSSGIPYDMYAMTAAHKSLPIPTHVRVTHQANGRSIVVKVNDRGPFVGDRIIDLSYAAAVKLDMIGSGTAPVEVVALPPYQYLADYQPPQRATQRLASTDPGQAIAPPVVGDMTVEQGSEDELLAKPSKSHAVVGRTNVDSGFNPMPSTLATNSAQETTANLPTAELIAVATRSTDSLASNKAPSPPLSLKTNITQTSSKSTFFLQAGAFARSVNAEQLYGRLANLIEHPVHIAEPSDAIYRVRIGPLVDLEQTKQLQDRLAALGIDAHPVVFD